MNKITIFGAGRVGETAALCLTADHLCSELMLIDINQGMVEGCALDLQQSAPLLGFDTRIRGSINPADVAGSGLVIITAGIARKPGMSRSDVIDTNMSIIDNIVDAVVEHAPDALILLVSNPVDVLTYRAFMRSGWPRNRIFGQAGVLDSTRMETFIALETGLSVKDIHAMVLGGHGDTMVPLIRFSHIGGIPLEHFISQEKIAGMVQRTRDGGAEILALRQNSSAYDAPAAAISTMVTAISRDLKRILPTVALLDGEYGIDGIAMGVPCVLGANGVEKIIELDLNDHELSMFNESADHVRGNIDRIRDK